MKTAAHEHFNPTRVRLKLEQMAEDGVFEGLQPHEGTSETGPALTGAVSMGTSHFNPTRGLKRPEKQTSREDPSSSETSTPRGYV